MTVGVICALGIEVEGLKAEMERRTEITGARMTYTQGTIGGVQVVAVECGIGKVNAAICAQQMIDLFKPDMIINSGIAGALSEQVGIADIVIAGTWCSTIWTEPLWATRLGKYGFMMKNA